MMPPYLVKNMDTWDLVVDGVKTVKLIKGAFQAWFVAFLVFQVEYPSTLKNS